jgi:pyridoxamine 5'-phosphate oxidase
MHAFCAFSEKIASPEMVRFISICILCSIADGSARATAMTGELIDPRSSLADRRTDYRRSALDLETADTDPFRQFSKWFDDAIDACRATSEEPHAMTLATSTGSGRPSARTVLLKGFDENGFVWFTNYDSRKGRELAENPWAALNFRWGALERQINVCGSVARVDPEESDTYFFSRPLGSRIGAVISPQSQVVENRETLDAAAAALAAGPPEAILRPAHWGGYRLAPDSIEFWQGRPNRVHDRLRYRRRSVAETDGAAEWVIERLAP